ncbi:MAG TPA: zf-HC2 domain-containing protein [Bacteroidota bacterium]|nr:zf-HC2 domain-containing protein [Bacteroidota bacterium]
MNEDHCTPEDLHMLLDGALSPAESAAARAHIASCPGCASRYSALRRLDGAIRALPLLTVSPGFTSTVMSALDPVMPVSRPFRFFTWVAFQVCLISVLLFGLGVCALAGFITPGGEAPGGIGETSLAMLESALSAGVSFITSLLGNPAHAGPYIITLCTVLVVLMLAPLDRIFASKLTHR